MSDVKIQTVVGVFLDQGRLLMEMRSAQKKVYAGLLMCPSGHVEEGEGFERAFEREMLEELGIGIMKSRLLFSMDDADPSSRKEFTHNFMLVESYEGKIGASNEALELRWLTYDEAKREKLALIVERLVDRLRGTGMF
jgi:8-oxo-dGTP pyrophosphatase MutT (NUDIX family)